MEKFVALKTCFWGPTVGTQSLHIRGSVILAHGGEPGLLEFFEPEDKPAPAELKAPAKTKPAKGKPSVEDLNDL